MRMRGFTLVELVMVIMITGILAASVTVFLKPAIDGYFDTRRRADLTDIADTALRRMAKDIRSAVPNSIRSVTSSCFQLVPTIAGGRYRLGPDTDPTHAGSLALDITQPISSFDVLSPLSVTPAKGDWVVIDNQNTDDVYTSGINKAAIDSITGAVVDTVSGTTTLAQHRITIDADTTSTGIQPFQFPSSYEGGRFVVVPNAEQTIFYSCVGSNLYRTVGPFSANQATTCAATSGAIVATDVASSGCIFIYNLNPGATQESGFVWTQLQLSRAGESVVLAQGVHVDNVP